MVVLTVSNAYLLAVADETQIASVEAQVATAKVSLERKPQITRPVPRGGSTNCAPASIVNPSSSS